MFGKLYYIIRQLGIRVFLNAVYPLVIRTREKAVGKKDKIEVVFFAVNVMMWRYQGVYELLSKDSRFNCHIVLTGGLRYPEEQKRLNLKLLRDFFKSRNIDFIDFDENDAVGYDVKRLIDPDILFYPQPYEGLYVKNHNFTGFRSKLVCYIPYAINVLSDNEDDWMYDTNFHNLAWKLYYPFEIFKQHAEKITRNHARNVVVSGYPNLDDYLSNDSVDVWKIKNRSMKRLIWAPHFSLPAEGNWITRSTFLWMSSLMLSIAKQFEDRLQIAFKPHPWLKSILYKYPEWGKEKTDSFFEQWDTMPNTFIASEYVQLFKTSDAMIHDSGSFTAEYLFVNKPVAFVTQDEQLTMSEHSEFGRMALNQHYIVKNERDVCEFIEKIVLSDYDPKANQRQLFFEQVLRPNVNGTTSQIIVNDIKRSLDIS